jgi:hypothetical protein
VRNLPNKERNEFAKNYMDNHIMQLPPEVRRGLIDRAVRDPKGGETMTLQQKIKKFKQINRFYSVPYKFRKGGTEDSSPGGVRTGGGSGSGVRSGSSEGVRTGGGSSGGVRSGNQPGVGY